MSLFRSRETVVLPDGREGVVSGVRTSGDGTERVTVKPSGKGYVPSESYSAATLLRRNPRG